MRPRRTAVWMIGLACAVAACASAGRQGGPIGAGPGRGGGISGGPTPAPRLFDFRSALWIDLHHFLYAQARTRRGYDRDRPAITAALADTAGLGARPAEERRAWEEALAYYERVWAPRDLTFDSAAVETKDRLALAESRPTLAGAGIDAELAAVLERAAPVYRAVWWSRHDAANLRWADDMRPLLVQYGDTIAAGVARAFRVPWPAAPIRVDLSPYTNWAGAYTTERPSHIMVASLAEGYRGTLGLEMLFHEALHTLEDSVGAARTRAGVATGKRVPYDLVHALIFWTAGEVTRRAVPGHTPYIDVYGFRQRGSIGRYFPLIDRYWRPYLDGAVTMDEAMRAIAAEL